MEDVVAIITARGGSKGLPRKNMRSLCGVPLIGYTIQAAVNVKAISRVYVTTDDSEIAAYSASVGASVIDRPALLASDSASSADAVRHALDAISVLEGVMPKVFVLLQPTSPLRTAAHLSACLQAFFAAEVQSCMSVTEAEHHPYKTLIAWDGMLRPLRTEADFERPRQSLPRAFRPNGAIYVVRSPAFLELGKFHIEPARYYEMPSEASVDIDSEVDLRLAEILLCDGSRSQQP